MGNKDFKIYKNIGTKNAEGKETLVLKGAVADANTKTGTPINTVGVNLGITLNMGNYQSMRIDVWSTDRVGKNETRKEAIFRVANELAITLHELQDKYGE